jgi:malate permease and related proteins
VNAPTIAIVLTLAVNATGVSDHLPGGLLRPVLEGCRLLGLCAVPIGLLVVGSTLHDFLREPRQLWDGRVLGSILLRLAILPWMFLAAAKWLPLSLELKQVMVVQAGMPAGMVPLLLARLYGGQPLVAAQVIDGTTAAALVVIPWWIDFGARCAVALGVSSRTPSVAAE